MSEKALATAFKNVMLSALRTASDRVIHLDGFVNQVTGFGTTRDKTTYGRYVRSTRLTLEEMSEIYHSHDLAAKVVDLPGDEMLREGFTVETGDEQLDEDLAVKLDELNVDEKLADAIRWDRTFGGSAIVLGADDGRDVSRPLDPEKVKALTYLYVIDRRLLWPVSYYSEPGHPQLGKPDVYQVTSLAGYGGNGAVNVHESRLILFRGTPTADFERLELASWGVSVLQRVHDVLRMFDTSWKAVETMLTDGNQAIFKMTGLAEAVASKGESLLRSRIQIMDLYRSVMRAIVVDAEGNESFERQAAEFRSIPEALDRMMVRVAAAADVPVTRLMGRSPAGLNATGESDIRGWYDSLRSKQTTKLAPRIRQISGLILKTKDFRERAQKATKLDVCFPPLWTPTPLEQATIEKTLAEADAVRVQSQIFLPDEVALARGRPKGYQQELLLTKEGIKAREAALKGDLDRLEAGTPEETAEAGAPTEADIKAVLNTTPSGNEAVITVNELRANMGLPPFPGPDGKLTLPEFKAKHAEPIAEAAAAEDGTKPGEKPKPDGGGGGFFGG